MTPAAELEQAVRQWAAERRYRAALVERWLRLNAADGRVLLDLAIELRLGENQLRDVWDCAEDIAARDRCALAAVLAAPPVTRARRSSAGRSDRLKAVKATLRRLRYPQLVATEQRLAELVRQLELPRNVHVTLPDWLEGNTVRVDIVADSAHALASAAAALHAAATRPECAAVFSLLEEPS
jgi:hypothetical protein